MNVLNYVDRFPEIRHLSGLEQWKWLKLAHKRVFASWKGLAAIVVWSVLTVMGTYGAGICAAWLTGWSTLAGGAAASMMLLGSLFLLERVYSDNLQRTVREMQIERTA